MLVAVSAGEMAVSIEGGRRRMGEAEATSAPTRRAKRRMLVSGWWELGERWVFIFAEGGWSGGPRAWCFE